MKCLQCEISTYFGSCPFTSTASIATSSRFGWGLKLISILYILRTDRRQWKTVSFTSRKFNIEVAEEYSRTFAFNQISKIINQI